MKTRTIRSALIGSLGMALALASGSALATSFRLTELGTLGGAFSEGEAINASGQVTGISETADAALSRLPVGRHRDAGPRHAGGLV